MANLFCPPLADGWLDRLEAVSREVLGLDHLSGRRLTQAVLNVSHAYTRQRAALSALRGDDAALGARLQFFLPRDLLKLHGPLAELASVGALPASTNGAWRVLDLGAGLGSTSLGLARFAALSGGAVRLEVSALDVDPAALELFEVLSRDLTSLPGVPLTLSTRTVDIAHASFARTPIAREQGPFEFILLGLALNELHQGVSDPPLRAAKLAERLIELSTRLSDDGVLIVIEPALRETSRALHAVRDLLVARKQAPHVFAPCLTHAACPMLARERDFCHERIPFALPPRLAELAASAGLRDADLTYSYLSLRKRPGSLRELAPEATLFRVVSGQIASKGKRELWLCGESGAPRATRLDRHRSTANAAFAGAQRGSILRMANAVPESASLRIQPETQLELVQDWPGGEG
jgi:SAM-dependent methyltransferase